MDTNDAIETAHAFPTALIVPIHHDGPSGALVDELRRHDVYVTASRIEACPNSLLEAMHCGLPALAIRSGAHPESWGAGGELFDDVGDALLKLDLIAARYDEYRFASWSRSTATACSTVPARR